MAITKARTKAAERFVEQNPWWKEGSTRGKVFVTMRFHLSELTSENVEPSQRRERSCFVARES